MLDCRLLVRTDHVDDVCTPFICRSIAEMKI